MGDGLNGLALAIFLAIAAIVLVATGLFLALGRMLGQTWDTTPRRRQALTAGLSLVGSIAGVLVAIAIFADDVWSPPPDVRVHIPSGYRYASVILLEDPSASRPIEWHGIEAPFMARWTRIDVPAGGVIRVRDVSSLAHGGFTSRWSDGTSGAGMGGGSAISALHASQYITLLRQPRSETTAADDLPTDEADIARYIAARERVR